MKLELAEKQYREFLSRKRMFYTRERALIFRAIFARNDHFSADDLLFYMRQENINVSRATLYRSLSHLVEAGVLVEADFGHGHIHYERLQEREPHDHLVCKKCGKVIEVSSQALLKALESLAAGEGFSLESHRSQLFGQCRECRGN